MPDQDFWLYIDGLRSQSRPFGEWAEVAAEAKSWMQDHPISDAAQHWAYSRGATAAIDIREAVIDWLGHLESVLRGVAAELEAVATDGEQMDLEEQANIDASDPQTYSGYDTSTTGSGDVLDPEAINTTDYPAWGPRGGGAQWYLDHGETYENMNTLSDTIVPDDLLSPSQWVFAVLELAGAQDLADRVMEDFGGRWGDLHLFAVNLSDLGLMLREMSESLSNSALIMRDFWKGVAADSAQEYFSDLFSSLDEAADLLSDAGDSFTQYVEGVESSAEIVAGLLHDILDTAIFAAVSFAVGGATLETVVGGILGGSAGAIAVARVVVLAYEVKSHLDDLQTLADILSAVEDLSSPLYDFVDAVPVPAMEDAA